MQKNKTSKKAKVNLLENITIITILLAMFIMLIPNKIFANSVEYIGGAEQLIVTPDDFFLNFGELLPGDVEEDVAYIKNNTKDEIEVFFKTEPLERTEYYDDIDYSLLEKINLEIKLKKSWKNEEKILYKGNLGAESMSEYISLGKYQKGYNGEFIFKIEVPKELRNEYTLSRTKVKWVFAVEKKDNQKPSQGVLSDSDDEDDNNNNGDKNIIQEIIENVKTGDNIYFVIGILVFVIAINVVLVVVLLKRKKTDVDSTKENENKK